jgi:hypothetical protein
MSTCVHKNRMRVRIQPRLYLSSCLHQSSLQAHPSELETKTDIVCDGELKDLSERVDRVPASHRVGLCIANVVVGSKENLSVESQRMAELEEREAHLYAIIRRDCLGQSRRRPSESALLWSALSSQQEQLRIKAELTLAGSS